MSDIFYELVHLIPEGWHDPSMSTAKLRLDDDEWSTEGFVETDLCISCDIEVRGSKRGHIQVCYMSAESEQYPRRLVEEQVFFLDAVAHDVSAFVSRKDLILSRAQQHRELGIFTSLLRHDVRNDLGVILSNIDLARMLLDEEDREMHGVIDSTEAVCERVLALISALGESQLAIEGSIEEWLPEVAAKAEETYRNLTVHVNVDDSVGRAQVPVSRLLPAVFDNLLRNAARYAGDQPNVTIDAATTDDWLEIVVSDDGPGVAEEIRDDLFQRGVTTSGSGLGLYLSKQIVVGIGGTIRLINNDGPSGAAFQIRLPIREWVT